MGKRAKKVKRTIVPLATEVDIDIKVSVQEVHTRTGTICDKRSRTLSFSLGEDFEKGADWLKSHDAYVQFGDLCVDVRKALALNERGAK